jgi:hypothetical protein
MFSELKKGELELELKSDDARFIEAQMDNLRATLLASIASPRSNGYMNPPSYSQHVALDTRILLV